MQPNRLPVLQPSQPLTLSAAAIPLNYVNPGMSLAQILAILRAYRRRSIHIALTVIVLTGLVIALMPRSYVATATLMLDYRVNDPLGGEDFPIGLMGNYMATQIDLMQSAEVLQPVIARLNLTARKSYAAGYAGDGSTLNDWVMRKLVKNLTVEQGRYGSQLISISYSATDPKEAAQVANAIFDSYSEEHRQSLNGPGSDRARRYTEQLAELKAKVERAQEQVTDFHRTSGLIASDVHIDVDMEILSGLEQRLLEAQNAERSAEVGAAVDRSVTTPVLSSSLIESLKTQLASEQSRLAEVSVTLGPRHPQVLELQSQIAASRRALASELQTYNSSATADVDSTRQMVRMMQSAVDAQRQKVLGLHQLQDEAAKYLLELDSAQTVYKRALDSYDQIMVTSNGHYTNVRSVSRAVPPLRSSKPNVLKLFLLGTLFGVGAAIAGPFLYEMLHRRVRCRDDLERDHGIPVLAELHIPHSSAAPT